MGVISRGHTCDAAENALNGGIFQHDLPNAVTDQLLGMGITDIVGFAAGFEQSLAYVTIGGNEQEFGFCTSAVHT